MTPTDPVLTVRVASRPVTQGSKTGIPIRRTDGGISVRMVESGDRPTRDGRRDRLKTWRQDIIAAVLRETGGNQPPLTGPVRVVLLFSLPKPLSAPKRKRTWPIGKYAGDVDKLTRAVFDALTDAGVWGDDGQVVDARIVKDYPGPSVGQMVPGVIVRVWEVAEDYVATPVAGIGPIPQPSTPVEVGVPGQETLPL